MNWVFAVMPANAEPLLFAGRGERVEDLGEAVRSGLRRRRLSTLGVTIAIPVPISTATGIARM